jgi:hypothetical protein
MESNAEKRNTYMPPNMSLESGTSSSIRIGKKVCKTPQKRKETPESKNPDHQNILQLQQMPSSTTASTH